MMYKDLRTCALLFSCIVMGLLSGCSGNEGFDEFPAYITFSTSINDEVIATRAVDNQWDKDKDEVGIFMINSDFSQYLPATHFGNKLHKPSLSGNVACELKPVGETNQLYYPTNGDNVGFVGYYPYKSGSVLGTNYAVKIETVQDVAKMAGFDLLWYRTATTFHKKSTDNPKLVFVHQLSKIIVAVTLSDPEMKGGSVQKVEMTGIPTEAGFALSTGTLSGQKTPAAVQLHTVTTNKDYLGIIIPHTSGTLFKSRTLKFYVTDPAGNTAELSHPIADTYEFKKDNVYTYNVTLTRKKVIFNGCTISDWGTKNSNNGIELGN